jgi:peptidoglycan/LPS O-acetylase OafA/YrhL
MRDLANPTTTTTRLPELDGLRAVAILLVLCRHIFCFLPPGWLCQLTEMGWIGVDLFFVLSGFLIGGILLDQRDATNYYQVFYLRRFFRIVPLYALLVLPGLLALSFGLQSHFGAHSLARQSALNVWPCLFFVQNFYSLFNLDLPKYLGPTWSVAVEEQFYLLLPLLVRNLDPKRLLKILVSGILFAPLLRIFLFHSMGNNAARSCYELLPCRWDALLLGVSCAVIYREPQYRGLLAESMGRLRAFWLLSAMGSIVLLSGTDGPYNPRLGGWGFTLLDLFFACSLLLAVMNPRGILHGLLSRPLFKPIATISYGVYLIHMAMLAISVSVFHAVFGQFAETSWPEAGAAALSLVATFLIATLSWKFFESPLIRRGHQYQFRRPVQGNEGAAIPLRSRAA